MLVGDEGEDVARNVDDGIFAAKGVDCPCQTARVITIRRAAVPDQDESPFDERHDIVNGMALKSVDCGRIARIGRVHENRGWESEKRAWIRPG